MTRPLPGSAAANRTALARLVAADPVLVDCVPAREALGFGEHAVLHAGPPISWGRMCPALRGAIIGALRYEDCAAADEDAASLEALARPRGVA